MTKKINLRQFSFDCALVIYVVYTILFDCSYIGTLAGVLEVYHRIVWCFCILLLVYVVVNEQYTRNELIKIIFLILIGMIVTIVTQDESTIMFSLFCSASKNIDFSITFKKIYKYLLLSIVLIIVLAICGIITNSVTFGSSIWDRRKSLGFKHPNYCGTLLIDLCLLRFIVKKGILNKKDIIFIVIVTAVNLLGPKTKTCLILVIFILVFVFISNFLKEGVMDKIMKIAKYIPILGIILTFLILYIFLKKEKLNMIDYNSLYDRIIQMAYYFQKYKITAFGQVIETISYRQVTDSSMVHTLDNGFMYLIIGKGVVFFLLYIYLNVKSIIYSIKEKKYYLTLSCILMVIWGLVETNILRVSMVPIIIVYSFALFCDKK